MIILTKSSPCLASGGLANGSSDTVIRMCAGSIARPTITAMESGWQDALLLPPDDICSALRT